MLRKTVLELSTQYRNPVKDHQYMVNIVDLINTTKDEILIDGQLNFGSAQKLLNLFLKYEWCRGKIPEQPHCPVERVVLSELSRCRTES